MSSILISSRSFTPGPEIAKAVATALELELMGESLYREAADRFSVPDRQLRRALQDRPSLWGLSSSHRRRLATCVRAMLSSRLAQGDAVYHGPFAGLLLRGVSHLLKVRITSSPAARAQEAGRQGLSSADAMRRVESSDRDQNDVARDLFGLDDLDTDYDLAIDLTEVEPDAAVAAIVECAQSAAFLPPTFSRRLLQDYAVADELGARLGCELNVDAEVRVHKGTAKIRAEAPERKRAKIQSQAESCAATLGGIQVVDVEVVESWLHPLPAHLR